MTFDQIQLFTQAIARERSDALAVSESMSDAKTLDKLGTAVTGGKVY